MEVTLYEKIGREKLKKLIRDFYLEIRKDTLLLPMYKGDLDGAEQRLFLFMVQYLGGPDTYNQLRGHPRLRMRHMVFPINDEARVHWLRNMKAALDKSSIGDAEKEFLWHYFSQTAEFLKNR